MSDELTVVSIAVQVDVAFGNPPDLSGIVTTYLCHSFHLIHCYPTEFSLASFNGPLPSALAHGMIVVLVHGDAAHLRLYHNYSRKIEVHLEHYSSSPRCILWTSMTFAGVHCAVNVLLCMLLSLVCCVCCLLCSSLFCVPFRIISTFSLFYYPFLGVNFLPPLHYLAPCDTGVRVVLNSRHSVTAPGFPITLRGIERREGGRDDGGFTKDWSTTRLR